MSGVCVCVCVCVCVGRGVACLCICLGMFTCYVVSHCRLWSTMPHDGHGSIVTMSHMLVIERKIVHEYVIH